MANEMVQYLSQVQMTHQDNSRTVCHLLKRILVIDLHRCTGCGNCEIACSVRNTRTFSPSRGRIHVIRDETRGLTLPMVCLQCEVPLCRDACPAGAIVENSVSVLTVDSKSCIGCQNCVTACVYGGIAMDPVTRKAIKCDLCDGDPACVRACEYHAIDVIEMGPAGLSARRTGLVPALQAYGLNSEEV